MARPSSSSEPCSPGRVSSLSSRSAATSSRPRSSASTSASSSAASSSRPRRRRRSRRVALAAENADEHQVIAVFSPKGGAGCTTLATNLALALRRETNQRVALVDANLQFGDVGVLLNLNPKNKSVLDAVEGGEPDRDIIETVMVDHSTGIRVLLAPPSPEGADLVTPTYLRKIVDMLRQNHDWVVVDLPSGLNDHTLGVLDAADQILVVAALEITTIKNVRLFLEVADQLDYERSKIRLVINRSDSSQGIRIGDVEASIRRTHRRHDRLRRSARRARRESRRAVRHLSSRVAARARRHQAGSYPRRRGLDCHPRDR